MRQTSIECRMILDVKIADIIDDENHIKKQVFGQVCFTPTFVLVDLALTKQQQTISQLD